MAERSSELDRLNDFGDGSETEAENVKRETTTPSSYVASRLNQSSNLNADKNDDVRTAAVTRRAETTDLATTDTDDDEDKTATTTANTADNLPSVDAAKEPEKIRAEIEQTRGEMSETINAIQDKLSFSNIATQVKDEVSDQISGAYESAKHALFGATAGKLGDYMAKIKSSYDDFTEEYGPAVAEAGQTVVRSAQSNPIPFALIGVGIGLLLLNSGSRKTKKIKSYRYAENDDADFDNENDETRYAAQRRAVSYSRGGRRQSSVSNTANQAYGRVSNVAGQAYENVSNAANSAYENVSNAAGSAYEGVGSVANKAYEGVGSAANRTYQGVGQIGSQVGSSVTGAARWTTDAYSQQLDENPFAVGAVAFALGAVVGLALPTTEVEGEYLGQYREQLLEKAQDAASGVIDKVQQVAGEVTKTVQEEAKSQGLTQ